MLAELVQSLLEMILYPNRLFELNENDEKRKKNNINQAYLISNTQLKLFFFRFSSFSFDSNRWFGYNIISRSYCIGLVLQAFKGKNFSFYEKNLNL